MPSHPPTTHRYQYGSLWSRGSRQILGNNGGGVLIFLLGKMEGIYISVDYFADGAECKRDGWEVVGERVLNGGGRDN